MPQVAIVMNEEQFKEALESARAERASQDAGFAARAESFDGETVQGKSGVDVLRGILAHRGWDERSGQVQMTQYVDAAHDSDSGGRERVGVACIVAPVGTGKTLGYLASALARGERVVVATSTKALQDQIVNEELPRLREDMLEAFGKHITYTVLKGKANYACLSHADERINRYAKQLSEFSAADATGQGSSDMELDLLRTIAQQARLAHARGDIANFDSDLLLARLSPDVRKGVTAKHACPVRKIDAADRDLVEIAEDPADPWRSAYVKSMMADVTVMNTALLVQEIIKQNNKPNPNALSLLEGVGMVVIDEAHHAPNIVTSAFSASLSRKDALKAAAGVDRTVEGDPFQTLTQVFFRAVDAADDEIQKKGEFHQHIAALCDSFARQVADEAERQSKKGSKKTPAALSEFREDVSDVIKEIGKSAARKTRRGEKDVYSAKVSVSWAEDGNDFTLSAVPVDVSYFKDRLVSAMSSLGTYSVPPVGNEKTIVLCSGTMNATVPRLLGLGGGNVMRTVESPFDPRRARLCVPSDLPLPKQQDAWEEAAWARAERAIRATGGRTLLLCTSYKAVERFHARTRALPYTVLRQGEGSRASLINRFIEDEHSILIATMGYWEGIDVPGPSLSLVIMDKIPFPVPTDAIATARREWVTDEGGNAFSIVDVGHASTMLAQGAGRLIRAEGDIGGVLILDPRLASARYASMALAQMEGRWLMYKSLDPFLGWLQTVAEAHSAGDPDMVLEHPRDTQPIRPKRSAVAAR